MGRSRRSSFGIALVASLTVAGLVLVVPSSGAATGTADRNLQRALDAFVQGDDSSPGISAVVQRGSQPAMLMTAGVADTSTKEPITAGDAMRLASVAKAFSGAAALSAVADGKLALDDTVGKILPDQPAAWTDVTLAQLLQHVSGVPDFSGSDAFRAALVASLATAPPPEQLLTYVADEPLVFPSGTKYEYSNSDNILVALMVAAVDGTPYEDSLTKRVYEPLGLLDTSLPAGVELPTPFVHGYQADPPNGLEDVSEVVAAGWAWASGGLVSTPQDANRFIRGYASGKTTTSAVHAQQFRFRAGKSDPTGPGTNAAGLAIFRYRTRCGVMFGHTGNTAGFTQFVASTRDGKRSAVVSINAQVTQKSNTKRFAELRNIFTLAACAALDGA
jgi:D-alanyl-D-alanine carboxypeptidase